MNLQELFNSILSSRNITLKTSSVTATNTFASWSKNYQLATDYNSQESNTCELSYDGKFAFLSATQYANRAGLYLQRIAYQLARSSRSPTRSPTVKSTRRRAVQHLSEKATNSKKLWKDESKGSANGEIIAFEVRFCISIK